MSSWLEKVRAALRADSRTGQSQPTSMCAWPTACEISAESVAGRRSSRAGTARAAAAFADRLRSLGLAVYLHAPIPGYPNDVDLILSDEGFGRNPCVETTAPIVGVIAPGPSSGKLATCLSQVYHENRRGFNRFRAPSR